MLFTAKTVASPTSRTLRKGKFALLNLVTFFSVQTLGVKQTWRTREKSGLNSPLPPGGVPTVTPAQQQSKWSFKEVDGANLIRFFFFFKTPAASSLCDSVPLSHILLLPGVASVNTAFGFGAVSVVFGGGVMMPVIHRTHAPSPDWRTRGCKHQRWMMRSMPPFINCFCLLIVPCARPEFRLLLIPTIAQQSHNNNEKQRAGLFPPRSGFSLRFSLFSSLDSLFFQPHIFISWEA